MPSTFVLRFQSHQSVLEEHVVFIMQSLQVRLSPSEQPTTSPPSPAPTVHADVVALQSEISEMQSAAGVASTATATLATQMVAMASTQSAAWSAINVASQSVAVGHLSSSFLILFFFFFWWGSVPLSKLFSLFILLCMHAWYSPCMLGTPYSACPFCPALMQLYSLIWFILLSLTSAFGVAL